MTTEQKQALHALLMTVPNNNTRIALVKMIEIVLNIVDNKIEAAINP